ncbi:Endonuclease NucS [Acidipropionibacterium virtanenii]|uniref:Endonuclease NucS n=1 Tax=Acidipropionibacterium virtanenii TaxID=2057246 RepID=A0A344UTW7_9ACTN|nr:Endonuclease NucS [Acidipropionibacterium virtanenii]
MRLVIAQCQVDYTGRLSAHLPWAKRLIVVKADGSVSVHADDRAYKPLNWMSPPCSLTIREPDADEACAVPALGARVQQVWEVDAVTGDHLQILLGDVDLDVTEDLGVDPGLQKDGVEAHLQELLAENPEAFGDGWSVVQREYMTPIGPVDILCRDAEGTYVAVEVKRRGEIDGVEQLTRYLDLMNRDHLLGGHVQGVFAAQQIKPQARTLAEDRGIDCLTVDYDALRGMDHPEERLF